MMASSRRRRVFHRGWLAVALCAAGPAASPSSPASELAATLPHVLFRGAPAGPAAMPGGDWSRANRSDSLSDASNLGLVWRRRVSGGIGCNALVDDRGRIFVAGSGHVTELGFDGRLAFRKESEHSECLAAALLADGSRLVLRAEGRLSAWSPRGVRRLDLELQAPARFGHSSLLPLPDGGILVSLGARLFDVGPAGELRSHAQASHELTESLVVGDRVILVDALGGVSEWKGESILRHRGTFGASVVAVAADATTLIGLTNRAALGFSLEQDEARPLFPIDRTGVLPLMSLPSAGRPVFLRNDGSVEQGRGTLVPPPPRPGTALEPLRDAQLIASRHGVVAWTAANLPLEIVGEEEPPRALPEVSCSQPASLTPAPRGHLVLACRTGQVSLIGPTARAEPEPIRPN